MYFIEWSLDLHVCQNCDPLCETSLTLLCIRLGFADRVTDVSYCLVEFEGTRGDVKICQSLTPLAGTKYDITLILIKHLRRRIEFFFSLITLIYANYQASATSYI